jgi:hypothetical protein
MLFYFFNSIVLTGMVIMLLLTPLSLPLLPEGLKLLKSFNLLMKLLLMFLP